MYSLCCRLAVTWLCVMASVALAAESRARQAASTPRPLPALEFARLVELERRSASIEGDDRALVLQQLAWARSVAGDHEGALEAFRRAFSSGHRRPDSAAGALAERARAIIGDYQPRDALAAIVEAARDRRIVILNEAHHVARHRAFALQLATELRKLDYEYLACEAFAPQLDAVALRERGYPTKADGTYLREPLFADFIRRSLQVGYLPVAYEQTHGSARSENSTDAINEREAEQAANLMERIFRQKPEARVLIYVGFSHLLKTARGPSDDPSRRVQWMAGRLKTLTGTEPLTIEQVAMTDPEPESVEAAMVQQLFGNSAAKPGSLVLQRAADGKFLVHGSYAGDADMQVFHAPTHLVAGRPDWLALNGQRQPRPVPVELLPRAGRRLVQAFVAGEAGAAIAMDQFVVSADMPGPPNFLLPAGEFRFAFDDAVAPSGSDVRATSVASGTVPRAESGEAFYDVPVPGPPFGVVATRDQRWAFVSLGGARNRKPLGIAVLRRVDGRFLLVHMIATPSVPLGVVLTHDGKSLIAAANDAVLVLDVERMIQGRGDPVITRFSYDEKAGAVYVNVTSDDGTLFISDERAARITVVDLRRVRAAGFSPDAIIGRIPVGNAPIALTFSPDGRWLYTTSQVAAAGWGWPKTVRREAQPSGDAPFVAEGAVVVIDVERAKREPRQAVVARVPAGGSPVRLAISPDGDRAYVTARNSNALLVFDTAKLRTGDAAARMATVPVGTAPVGVLVVDAGRRIIVTNSNRFGSDPTSPSNLAIVDAARISEGADAVVASVPAGAFPRELHLTADGRTVLLTNYQSHTVRVIDAAKLPGR